MKASTAFVRWALSFALIGSVIAFALWREHAESWSTEQHRANMPAFQLSPLEYQRKLSNDALARLELTAAPYDRAGFGRGTSTFGYKLAVGISEAFSWPNGTLLVVTSTNDPPGSMRDVDALATLDRGVLRPIPMPQIKGGEPGFSGIDLASGSVGDDPVISAHDFGGHEYFYVARPDRVVPIAWQSGKVLDVYTLSTGEECVGDSTATSPVAIWADGAGRRRPLVMKDALYRDSHNLLDERTLQFNSVRCFHLGDLDLVNIGDRTAGVVYAMIGGKLKLVTRGEVLTSGAHHILIFREETDTGGGFDRVAGERQKRSSQPGMIDYLEVFAR